MSERTAPSVTPSSSNDSPAPAPTDDLGQSARRGAVFIPLAKLWFLVSALLLQLLLPRALGSSALYGVWTLVSSWLSTFNNVMITATIQAVAYFAARGPSAVEHAKATAHVECRKDAAVIDESPAAYKSIDQVVARRCCFSSSRPQLPASSTMPS